MSRSVLCLLAFSMIFLAVEGLNFKHVVPDVVMSLHQQCVSRGHYAECWTFNRNGRWPHCGRTSCAARISRGGRYKEIKLRAHAPDGLRCGMNRMCYEGKCVRPNVPIPFQSFMGDVRLPVTCYH